jgi:hypothetical protein
MGVMKNVRLVIAVALCGLAASPAAARLLIGQSFERETWPPPGWRVESQTPPVAYWAREYSGKNWFARGCVGGAGGRGSTTLITKKLYLVPCSKITVTFDYKTTEEEFSSDVVRKVYLVRNDYETIWSRDLQSGIWKRAKAKLPPIRKHGGVYTFRWYVKAVTYVGSYVDLCIDNIRIEETNTAVAATSLGRVKALYR